LPVAKVGKSKVSKSEADTGGKYWISITNSNTTHYVATIRSLRVDQVE